MPKAPYKKIEVPTTSFLIAARNQLYCEPFDKWDPYHPIRGKKVFNENYRPFRANINLEILGDAVNKDKPKMQITIDAKNENKLLEQYSEQCDQKKMAKKHRGVSYDSSFHP